MIDSVIVRNYKISPSDYRRSRSRRRTSLSLGATGVRRLDFRAIAYSPLTKRCSRSSIKLFKRVRGMR